MKRAGADIDTLLAEARRFAAVEDAFAPEAALAQVMGRSAESDPVLAARVLSALRQDCTVATASGAERWQMRPGARRKALAGGAAGADADTPVADALAGRGDFAPAVLDRLIGGEADLAAMEAAAVALDRAGPSAPGFDRLDRLRSVLNTRRAEARADARLAGGFFGREAELARLADWITAPPAGPPMRTIHVSGLPGIGKSFLLERVIQQARLGDRPILVMLDFDRAGLNVLDAHGFFEEISRQVGDALPEAAAMLRDMRLQSAERRARETGSSARYSLPRELLDAMAGAVRQGGRRVLAVLDTLEVLRSRGETQVMTLFDRMDALCEYGVAPLAILSAGRGDALDPVPARVEDRIHLEGLEDGAARLLLQACGVAEALWPRILPLVQGNPLLLTLAANAFEDTGYDAADIPPGASEEIIGGYLYRAVLSRVPDRLRRIANEGLILTSIDAEALTEVVAPALGLSLARDEAQEALTVLATHHWLVEPDGSGGIRHRQDVRRAFLPLLYDGNAETRVAAEAINLAAAAWYQGRDPALALYHRLQSTRFGHPMPEVPADLALKLAGPFSDELPGPARDALLQAQGRRSGFARAGGDTPPAAEQTRGTMPPPALEDIVLDSGRPPIREPAAAPTSDSVPPAAAPDTRAVHDLELMLEKGDLREAGHVFRAGFAGGYAPDGAAGRAALCFLWLSGHWAAAFELFRAQPEGALRRALEESPHLRGRVFMEMEAEAAFGRLVTWFGDDEAFESARRSHDASQRIGMVGGALDFAFLATHRSGETLPRQLDLARSLLASASDPARAAPGAALALGAAQSAREAFGMAWEALADLAPGGHGPGARAEMLQALNPYGAALHALVSDEAEGRVAAFLAGLGPRLPEAAAVFVPALRGTELLPGRLTAGPPDVVAALTAMGLCADWSSAHVVGRARADLRRIARSAERWRRTVAGMWSYGRLRPGDWPGIGGVDRMSAERLNRIILAPDPVGAAQAQLGFWRDTRDAHARPRIARWVAAAKAKDGTDTGRPGKALAGLLAAGTPGVIAVPLAVLMAHGISPMTEIGGARTGDAG